MSIKRSVKISRKSITDPSNCCSGAERELSVSCSAQMPAIQGSQAPLERTLLLGRLTFPSWSYQVRS